MVTYHKFQYHAIGIWIWYNFYFFFYFLIFFSFLFFFFFFFSSSTSTHACFLVLLTLFNRSIVCAKVIPAVLTPLICVSKLPTAILLPFLGCEGLPFIVALTTALLICSTTSGQAEEDINCKPKRVKKEEECSFVKCQYQKKKNQNN